MDHLTRAWLTSENEGNDTAELLVATEMANFYDKRPRENESFGSK
jgi:hypothetical protein